MKPDGKIQSYTTGRGRPEIHRPLHSATLGRAQRNAYLKNLENRFIWLAESPTHGRHRTDITEGYYSFPEGQHIVFYLCSHNGIDIIGIPHKDMDILSYFQAR